ncbi:MAG: hypothetical protein ACRD15_06800 [Vicinamibacterales bacterium]
MRTLLLVAALLVPASASAVTLRDIIELTKAGLPDDVLVAIIDADRTIFTLDKDQILELKKAGVSKQVLLKMLRTRREFESSPMSGEEATPAVTESRIPQPEVVVIGAQPAPPPVTVVVPQYFYVPYAIWGTPTHRVPRTPPPPFLDPGYRGFGRFINDGWVDRR